MPDYEIHEPVFHDTTTERWEEPERSDFATEDLGAIDDHYLLSASGFPPASSEDLALAVVDADGRLNRHALENAHTGPDSVETLAVDDETRRTVKDLIESLLHEHFESTAEDRMAELQEVRFEAYEDYQEHMADYHLDHEDLVRALEAEAVVNPDLHRDEDPHSQQN